MRCSFQHIILIIALFQCGSFTAFNQSIFNANVVHEVRLTIEIENYWEILETNYQNYLENNSKVYIPVDIEIDNEDLDSVGLRFKGHYSNTGFEGVKKPFKLDFNEFIKDQTFNGIKKMNLQNFAADPSFLRDYTSYFIFKQFNIISPRAAYAKLYINDQYWGLYLIVEQIDDMFLEDNFKISNGNLFKCVNDTKLEYNEEELKADFELKTNKEENNWSDFFDLVSEINNPYAFDFAESITGKFDLDSYYNCLIIDVLLNNWDSYHVNGRNFFLYQNPEDDKFYWIPWDYNLAFWDTNMNLFPKTNNKSNELTPLVKSILTNQILKAKYIHLFCQRISDLNLNAIISEIDSKVKLIKPFVIADTNKFYSNEAFIKNINEGVTVKMVRSGELKDVYLPGITKSITDRRNFLFSEIANYPDGCYSENINNEYVSVHPTPIQSNAVIKVDLHNYEEQLTMHIIDVSGRIIASTEIWNSTAPFIFSFEYFSDGNYLIHVESKDQRINLFKKIMIIK